MSQLATKADIQAMNAETADLVLTEGDALPNLNVFGSVKAASILFPEPPISARANCQRGEWMIGDSSFGKHLAMHIIKFSLWFGDLGQTQDTLWGQMWFLPVAGKGSLPPNVAFLTYIKTRSLTDFSNKVTLLRAAGKNPELGIWTPNFQKHGGTVDGNPTQYYAISWDWEPMLPDAETAYRQEVVPQVIDNFDKLVDPVGTANMASRSSNAS